jgi:sulfur-oxidizing protein SoxY
MKHHKIIWLALSVILIFSNQAVKAEEVDKYFGTIQKTYYPNKTVVESKDVDIKAPLRAESGAQVPFEFNVNYPITKEQYVKTVSVIAGANPVPLVAIYHFNPSSGKAAIVTRIRLEVDSYVHVIAETNDGHYLMNKVYIKAAGGCGGTVGGDDSLARLSAGKMKLSVKPTDVGAVSKAHLLIKHPMYTGLQRDLVSQGFRPAFFINKIVAKFNGQVVFDADTYIGVSEDPNFQFQFKADQPGTLTVTATDNEGKQFTTSTDVTGS